MMIKSHFCQNYDVLIATQLSQQGFTLHLQNVIACYSITELTQHHTEIKGVATKASQCLFQFRIFTIMPLDMKLHFGSLKGWIQ